MKGACVRGAVSFSWAPWPATIEKMLLSQKSGLFRSTPQAQQAARGARILFTLGAFAMGVALPGLAQQPPAEAPAEPPRTQEEIQRDGRIQDEVRIELATEPDVRGAALQVEVMRGKVTLSGRVRNEKAREKAEEITRDIDGVTEVVSLLRLLTDP